jgi:hypothetical protein
VYCVRLISKGVILKKSIYVHSLPAISVVVLAIDPDIGVYDVLAVLDDIEPLGRVFEIQISNLTSLETNDGKENGPLVFGCPNTAVAVQGTATVNIDIGSTNLKERNGVLEAVRECVCRPVTYIWSKSNRSLDVYQRN